MTDHLLAAHWQADALKMMQSAAHATLPVWQKDALERFIQAGFPTRRDEAWRYTDLSHLAKQRFVSVSAADYEIDIDAFSIPETYRLTFVNGRYVEALSDQAGLPQGVILKNHVSLSEDNLLKGVYQTPFSDLNAAFADSGLLLQVPAHVVVDKPIHVLYLNTGGEEPMMHHPCHRIVAETGSDVSVFEEYVGLSEAVYFNNVVTHIIAQPNSRVHHDKLQRESDQAFHIANTLVTQHRDSHVSTANVTVGGVLSRDDLHYALCEEGASASLLGLYYLMGKRHVDHHSRIDHQASHCSSEQHYKGIVGGASRAVFNGKVVVHEETKQTVAEQSNQNLLLSSAAEIDTKPELEIYADDVKCTHGATIGQLDDNALFYLQSRGIDSAMSKHLLTCAFANEILQRLPRHAVSDHITQQVVSRLASSLALGVSHDS